MAQNPPPNPTPQRNAPRNAKQPKWTIMIYLAGDNNLSANSIDIMKDLEDAFPEGKRNDDVRVIACFDPNTPRPRGARYVEINHGRHNGHNGRNGKHVIPQWGLHNDLVPSGENGDRSVTAPNFTEGDIFKVDIAPQPLPKEGLTRFIEYTLEHHKADGYMLILFGHGGLVAGNTFLADNNPPSFLRLTEFAKILSTYFSATGEGGKPPLDILACDNCMMNGIESAYEIKDSVNYVLGSQGLMLAVGWPFRKIIEKIIKLENKEVRRVAHAVADVCARGLLDFALMDRSSDQSLLDLSTVRQENNIVTAVKQLSGALQSGLACKEEDGKPLYPAICDAVRLARLEAQSYFDETFVDLYDFCRLLLKKCNDAVNRPIDMSVQIIERDPDLSHLVPAMPHPGKLTPEEEEAVWKDLRNRLKGMLLLSDVMQRFQTIADFCGEVLRNIKFLDKRKELQGNFVVASYYIGPDLQYSNGVSIYFPWTMPDGPIIFSPVDETGGEGARRNGDGATDNTRQPAETPGRFELKTPFHEYTKYAFGKPEGGNWTAFLVAFFKATLRNVRLSDYDYEKDTAAKGFIKITRRAGRAFSRAEIMSAPAMNLHKSSSDMGYGSGDGPSPGGVKNYPRRFYLSPADRMRRCPIPGEPEKPGVVLKQDPDLPCVSYLGWNLRGLVAVQVGLGPNEKVNPIQFSAPVAPAGGGPSHPPEAGSNGEPPKSPSGAAEPAVAKDI